jgi:hypothetical protein
MSDEQETPAEPTPEVAEPTTFDADYVARLRKEAADYRTKAKANADAAKRLQEIEDANKSEAEKVAERLATAERRATAAERKALLLQVASEKGLTPKQAARLQGETAEELAADADDLLAEFKPADSSGRRPKESGRIAGTRDDGPPIDPEKIAETIFSRSAY